MSLHGADGVLFGLFFNGCHSKTPTLAMCVDREFARIFCMVHFAEVSRASRAELADCISGYRPGWGGNGAKALSGIGGELDGRGAFFCIG